MKKILGKVVFTASTIRRAATVAIVLVLGTGVSAVILTKPFSNKQQDVINNPIIPNQTQEEHFNDINLEDLIDEDEKKEEVTRRITPSVKKDDTQEEYQGGGGGGESTSSIPEASLKVTPGHISDTQVDYGTGGPYTLITSPEGESEQGAVTYAITTSTSTPGSFKTYAEITSSSENTVSEVGTYYIWYRIESSDTTKFKTVIKKLHTFKIKGLPGDITAPTIAGDKLELTGASVDLLSTPATSTTGTVKYLVSTQASNPTGTYETTTPVATEPGKYYVWYYSEGNTGYDDTTAAKVGPITVKNKGSITQTPTKAGSTLNYNNGSPVALLSQMATGTGTVKYKVTESASAPADDTGFSAYSSSPTATGASGQTKTYYVWYFAIETNTHYATEFAKVGPIQIKDNGSAPQPQQYCSTPSVPEVKGPFQFESGAQRELIGPSTPSDGSTIYYYLTTDASENVTESMVTSTAIPTASAIGDYYVWYCAKQNGFVSTTPKKVGPVKIVGAEGKVETKPTFNSAVSYNESNHSILNSEGSSSTGTLMFYYSTENVAPEKSDVTYTYSSLPQVKSVGKYYVWYYSKGDANHNDTDVTKLNGYFEITGGVSTINTPPELIFPNQQDYTGNDIDFLNNSGSATGGVIYFTIDALNDTVVPSKSSMTLTASQVKASEGIHHIWYYLKGDEGYSDIDPVYLGKITIVKQLASCISEPNARGTNGIIDITGEPIQLINGATGVTPGDTIYYSLGTSEGPSTWVEDPTAITGTDAGKYYVWWYIEGGSLHSSTNKKCITVTLRDPMADILPKASVVTAPKAITGLIKTDSEQELITEGSALNGDMYYAVTDSNAQPELNKFGTSLPTKKDAGPYYVWYFAKGDGVLYDNSVINKIPVKINSQAATIFTPPTPIDNLAYNGSEQVLVTAGTHDGAGMMYAVTPRGDGRPDLTDDTKWTSELPKAKDVGEYTVWYYALGSDSLDRGNSEVENIFVEIIIPKAVIQGNITAISELEVFYDRNKFRNNGVLEYEDQTLINVNGVTSSTGTSIYYALTDINASEPAKTSAAWSTVVPKAKNAGSYRIWYYAKGDGVYYSDSDVSSVTNTIIKTMWPYTGDTIGFEQYAPSAKNNGDPVSYVAGGQSLFELKDDPTVPNGTLYYYISNVNITQDIDNGRFDKYPFKTKAELVDNEIECGTYYLYCYVKSNDPNFEDSGKFAECSARILPQGSEGYFHDNEQPYTESIVLWDNSPRHIVQNAGQYRNDQGETGIVYIAVTKTNDQPTDDKYVSFGITGQSPSGTYQYNFDQIQGVSSLWADSSGIHYVWYFGELNGVRSSVYCKEVSVNARAQVKVQPKIAGGLAAQGKYKLTSSSESPIIAGYSDEGTMMYIIYPNSSGVADLFSPELPVVSEPGTYKITYHVEGDESHFSSDEQYINVTVIADASFVTYPQLSALLEDGQEYDGLAHSVLSSETKGEAKGGVIQYHLFTEDEVHSDTFSIDLASAVFKSSINDESLKAKNPGKYYLYAYVKAAQGYENSDYYSFDFTINKKDPTLPTVSKVNNLTDNGENHDLVTVSPNTSDIVYAVTPTNNAPAELSLTSIPQAKDAGTYYVWWKLNETDTCYGSSVQGPVTVTIAQGIKPKATYKTAPAIRPNLEYDGTQLPLLSNLGESDDGDIKYAVTSSFIENENDRKALSYSTTMPSKLNAGTYYIWYFIDSTTTKEDSSISYLSVNIAKADQTLDEPIVVSDPIAYDGQAHNLVLSAPTFTGNTTVEYYLSTTSGIPASTASWGGFNLTSVTDPGTYFIWYRAVESMNYKATDPQFTTAIIKAPGVIEVKPQFTSDVNIRNKNGYIEYTGDYILPITAGQSSTGTMKYAVSSSLLESPAKNQYTSDLSSIADHFKEPTQKVIWYYSDAGNSNVYSDSEVYSMNIAILKKKVTITTHPSINVTGTVLETDASGNKIYKVPFKTAVLTPGECSEGGVIKYAIVPKETMGEFDYQPGSFKTIDGINIATSDYVCGNDIKYYIAYYIDCADSAHYEADEQYNINNVSNRITSLGFTLTPIKDTIKTQAVGASNLKENGQALELFATYPEGNVGKIKYIVVEGQSTTAPSVKDNKYLELNLSKPTIPTKKEAGTYTVWYYSEPTDTTNYLNSDFESVTVTVAPEDPAKIAPTVTTNSYEIKQLNIDNTVPLANVTLNNATTIKYVVNTMNYASQENIGGEFDDKATNTIPTLKDIDHDIDHIEAGRTYYVSYKYSFDGGANWSSVHSVPLNINYNTDPDGFSAPLYAIDGTIYYSTQGPLKLLRSIDFDPDYDYYACVTYTDSQPEMKSNQVNWHQVSKGDDDFFIDVTAPGTVYIWWYAKGNESTQYAPTEIQKITKEISKPKAKFKDSGAPQARSELTYNGNSLLLIAGEPYVEGNNLTIKYLVKSSDDTSEVKKEDFSTFSSFSRPQATDPGTYKVWFYIEGNDIYADSDMTYIVAIIGDMVVEYDVPTVKTGTFTYTGSPVQIINPGTINNVPNLCSFKYAYQKASMTGTPTTFSTNTPAPIQAGIYNVYYYIEGPDGPITDVVKMDATFEIKKSSASLDLNNPSAFIPSGFKSENGQYISLLASPLTETQKDGRSVYFAVTPSTDDNDPDLSKFSDGEPKVVNAGTYYVWWYTPANSNYYESPISRSAGAITINPQEGLVEPQALTVVLTYNGNPQSLIKPNTGVSNTEIGRYEFAVKKGSATPVEADFKPGAPTAIDAGEYNIYYRYRYALSGVVSEVKSLYAKIDKKSIGFASTEFNGVINGNPKQAAGGRPSRGLGDYEYIFNETTPISVIKQFPSVNDDKAIVAYIVSQESYPLAAINTLIASGDLSIFKFEESKKDAVKEVFVSAGKSASDFDTAYGSSFDDSSLTMGPSDAGTYNIVLAVLPYDYLVYALDPQGEYDGNYYVSTQKASGLGGSGSNVVQGTIELSKQRALIDQSTNIVLNQNGSSKEDHGTMIWEINFDPANVPINVIDTTESILKIREPGTGVFMFALSTTDNNSKSFNLPKSEFKTADSLTLSLRNDQPYFLYYYVKGIGNYGDSEIRKYENYKVNLGTSPKLIPPTIGTPDPDSNIDIEFVDNYNGKLQLFNGYGTPGDCQDSNGQPISGSKVLYKLTDFTVTDPGDSGWVEDPMAIIIDAPGRYTLWYKGLFPFDPLNPTVIGPLSITLNVNKIALDFSFDKVTDPSIKRPIRNNGNKVTIINGESKPDMHFFEPATIKDLSLAEIVDIKYYLFVQQPGLQEPSPLLLTRIPEDSWKVWGDNGPEFPATLDSGEAFLCYYFDVKPEYESLYDDSVYTVYQNTVTVTTRDAYDEPPFDMPQINTNPVISGNTVSLITNIPSTTPNGWQYRYYYSKTTTLPRLDQFTSTVPTVNQAGTYYVYAAAFNITNNPEISVYYGDGLTSVKPTKVTVSKQTAEFDVEPEPMENLQYTGSSQILIKDGTGTLKPSISAIYAVCKETDDKTVPTPTSADFRFSKPQAELPGTYYVYAKLSSTSNLIEDSGVLYCFKTTIYPSRFNLSDLDSEGGRPEFYDVLEAVKQEQQQSGGGGKPRPGKAGYEALNPIKKNATIDGGTIKYAVVSPGGGKFGGISYEYIYEDFLPNDGTKLSRSIISDPGVYSISYKIISNDPTKKYDSEASEWVKVIVTKPDANYYILPSAPASIEVAPLTPVQLLTEPYKVFDSEGNIVNNNSLATYDSSVIVYYTTDNKDTFTGADEWNTFLSEKCTTDYSALTGELVENDSYTVSIHCFVIKGGTIEYGATVDADGGITVNDKYDITLTKVRTPIDTSYSSIDVLPQLLDKADYLNNDVQLLKDGTGTTKDGNCSFRYFIGDDPNYIPTIENDSGSFGEYAMAKTTGTWYVWYFIQSNNDDYKDSEIYYLGSCVVDIPHPAPDSTTNPHLASSVDDTDAYVQITDSNIVWSPDYIIRGSAPGYVFEYCKIPGSPVLNETVYNSFSTDFDGALSFYPTSDEHNNIYTIWWRSRPETSNDWTEPSYFIVHYSFTFESDNDYVSVHPTFREDTVVQVGLNIPLITNNPDLSGESVYNRFYVYAVTKDPNANPDFEYSDDNNQTYYGNDYTKEISSFTACDPGTYYIHYIALGDNDKYSKDFVREVHILPDPNLVAEITQYAEPYSLLYTGGICNITVDPIRPENTLFTAEVDTVNGELMMRVQPANDPAPTYNDSFETKKENINVGEAGVYKIWYYARGKRGYQNSDIFSVTVVVTAPTQLSFVNSPTFNVGADGKVELGTYGGRILADTGTIDGEGHLRVYIGGNGQGGYNSYSAAEDAEQNIPGFEEGAWQDIVSIMALDNVAAYPTNTDLDGYAHFVIFYYAVSDSPEYSNSEVFTKIISIKNTK